MQGNMNEKSYFFCTVPTNEVTCKCSLGKVIDLPAAGSSVSFHPISISYFIKKIKITKQIS